LHLDGLALSRRGRGMARALAVGCHAHAFRRAHHPAYSRAFSLHWFCLACYYRCYRIPRMAQLHGTTNALGFAFCGLLGWAIAYGAIQRPASPSVDSATNHSIGPYGVPGRTVAAFLIAPLTVPVVFNGIAVISDVYTSGASPSRLLDGVLFSLYTLPFAYFAELVLGVPVWLAFKYFRIRSFSAFAAGGALIGLLFCAIWDWPANFTLQSLAQAFDPFWLAIFVIPASASATLFRAIAFSKPKRLLSS